MQIKFTGGLFLFAAAAAAFPVSVQAEVLDVSVYDAGTLAEQIPVEKRGSVTELKITGPIDGSDLRLIRELAGVDYMWHPTDGRLVYLDLSGAVMVEGGEPYACAEGSQIEPVWMSARKDALPEELFSRTKIETIVLPESITTIYSSFADAEHLKGHIVVPEGVEILGEWAFANTAIEGITLPSTLCDTADKNNFNKSALGSHVFDGCSRLREISFPDGVTLLKGQAFANCVSLTSITIPATIESIGSQVFMNCTGIKDIYVMSEQPAKAQYEAFKGMDFAGCRLHVPEGCGDNYRYASEWNSFMTIVDDVDLAGVHPVVKDGGVVYDSRLFEITSDCPIEVYDMSGERVASSAGGNLSIAGLPHGVYVVSSDGSTFKVLR